jgi:hypothetical protein
MKMKLLSAAVLAAGLFSATAAVQADTLVFSPESDSAEFGKDAYFQTNTYTWTGYFWVNNALDSSGVSLFTPSYVHYSDIEFTPYLILWDSNGTQLARFDSAGDWGTAPGYSARIDYGYLDDGKYSFTIGNAYPSNTPDGTPWPGGWGDGNWQVTVNGAFSSAVPEPETWAMLLVGLGMVSAVARRRKQR